MSRERERARARARTNVSKYRFRTSDPSGFGGVEPMQQLSSNRQLTSTVRIAIGLPERLLLLLLPPPCIAKANECAEVCVHSKEALPPPHLQYHCCHCRMPDHRHPSPHCRCSWCCTCRADLSDVQRPTFRTCHLQHACSSQPLCSAHQADHSGRRMESKYLNMCMHSEEGNGERRKEKGERKKIDK